MVLITSIANTLVTPEKSTHLLLMMKVALLIEVVQCGVEQVGVIVAVQTVQQFAVNTIRFQPLLLCQTIVIERLLTNVLTTILLLGQFCFGRNIIAMAVRIVESGQTMT